MTTRERDRLIGNYATKMGEHFDAVLILVSHTEGRSTGMGAASHGNYYAKRGMAMEWLAREDERSRIDVRPVMDDDSDDWKTAGAGI